MAKPETSAEEERRIQTNWYVLTGAPCSGKTTVINELARRGHGVVHETARAYIEANLARGLSMDQIRGDESAFEHLILEKKAVIEEKLDIEKAVFFDRAVPDSIAYFRLADLDPTKPIVRSRRVRYRKIFLLDRLPVKEDSIRKEDEQTSAAIETLLVECYRDLGYSIIRIPVFTAAKRADLILQHLQ